MCIKPEKVETEIQFGQDREGESRYKDEREREKKDRCMSGTREREVSSVDMINDDLGGKGIP